MGKKTTLLVAVAAGAVLAVFLQIGVRALAAGADDIPPPPKGLKSDDIPPPPKDFKSDDIPPPPKDIKSEPKQWEPLEFNQTIPVEWGTVISINRVQKGGESYTFWFLGTDGTLRGVTTREFTGPNRASFFPEVYVIHRR